MSVLVEQPEQYGAVLAGDVLAHLDAQLAAARRLLSIVLDQGAAIRRRDVAEVVTLTGILHAEMQRRALIDRDRARLLERAGVRLGLPATAVTVGALATVMDPMSAEVAQARSAQLRGLLEEIQREHHVNRALMTQELSFLDHLLRLADSERSLGYDSGGDHSRPTAPRLAGRHRVLDVEV